jgi:hypothetical protein
MNLRLAVHALGRVSIVATLCVFGATEAHAVRGLTFPPCVRADSNFVVSMSGWVKKYSFKSAATVDYSFLWDNASPPNYGRRHGYAPVFEHTLRVPHGASTGMHLVAHRGLVWVIPLEQTS